jgi:glycosyltransferase involved in cell wall biosynthesis
LKRHVRGVRLLYDVRGDAAAEQDQLPDARDKARRVRAIERAIVEGTRAADAVFAVSRPLRSQLIERYGADPRRTFVVPGLARAGAFHFDARVRAEMRGRHGLEGKKVLIFPGSVGRWHHLDATLAVVRAACALDPAVHFIALSPHTEAMEAAVTQALPPGRYRVLAAAHGEVSAWLQAADAGLLLRERHPINRVAAPTKLAEYLLCGLPAIVTPEIGDYSELVARSGAGAVIDETHPEEAARSALAALGRSNDATRTRLATWARARLSKEVFAPWLAAIYRAVEAGAADLPSPPDPFGAE